MRYTAGGLVLLIAGILVLACAILQGMVLVPHLREDMVEIQVRQTLLTAVMLVLYFSVVATFAFAVFVLGAAVNSFRGGQPELFSVWGVALFFMIFGIGSFVLVSPNPHFLGYAGIGLLAAIGAYLARQRPA